MMSDVVWAIVALVAILLTAEVFGGAVSAIIEAWRRK